MLHELFCLNRKSLLVNLDLAFEFLVFALDDAELRGVDPERVQVLVESLDLRQVLALFFLELQRLQQPRQLLDRDLQFEDQLVLLL